MKKVTVLYVSWNYDYSTRIYKNKSQIVDCLLKDQDLSPVESIVGNKKYKPTEKDRLYFLPKCKVPRFKLKTFYKKYKAATTRNINAATALFINGSSFSVSRLSCEYIYEYKKVDPVSGTFIDYIALGHRAGGSQFDGPLKYIENEINNCSKISILNLVCWDSDQELLRDILSNTHKIYLDSDLTEALNVNVMTREQFQTVQNLLRSSDAENHDIAIETMANCDYKRSAVYLLLLAKNHGNRISYRRSSKHVNFKAMLEFFNINDIRYVDLNQIINILKERRLLNQSNLDILMPNIHQELENKNHLDKHVSMAGGYTEETLKSLEENILDKDFNTQMYEEPDEELNPNF